MNKNTAMSFLICLALVLGVFLFGNMAKSANTDIIITEIGAYESSGHEWIEIYNKGAESIDMDGWIFWEADTNHGLTLVQGDDTLIEPGEYAMIVQNDLNFVADYATTTASSTIFDSSWGSLKESGETIGLKDADGNMVEQFSYIAAPDFSLERKRFDIADYSEDNWLEHPNGNSVGAQNYWHVETQPNPDPDPPPENIPPTAIFNAPTSTRIDTPIFFDASSSTDADGTIMLYEWNFGDGTMREGVSTTHAYSATGTFSILLTIVDNEQATSTASTTIAVTQPEPEPEELPEETAAVHIVVNELLPNPESGEKEWIELYNTATTTADLSGVTIEDGTGVIAAPSSTIPGEGFITITLPSSKLNNSGDIVIVKNSDGDVIDQVTYGDWEDADTSDNAEMPSQGQSLARVTDGYDSDLDYLDFAKTDTPTPLESNIIELLIEEDETNEEQQNEQNQNNQPPPSTPAYSTGDIVINELVSDPADGYDEFVELYNRTGESIDLKNWWIEEGSGAKTPLDDIIAGNGFVVIEKPKGNLNNGGDVVRLFAPTGSLIDDIAYGNWSDGNTADNAPRADDPLSIARVFDGKDTDSDMQDFSPTKTVTRGGSNIILKPIEAKEESTEEKQEEPESATITYPEHITITEVFPNPIGSDAEDEFIEILNTGPTPIDLNDWKLGDGSSRRYTFSNIAIDPGEYIAVKRSTTGIALNNSGSESVLILAPNGNTIDSIVYEGPAPEGESYARRADNRWSWTTNPTPGEINIFETKETAEIILDTEEAEESTTISSEEDKDISPIILSEFLPNPVGSDDAEFIEVFNTGNYAIDLAGLKLDDIDGGSRPFTIPQGTVVPPKTYYVFPREQTNLALNNSGDSVRLLRPNGDIITSVSYNTLPEGTSYAQNEDGEWLATGTPTPGAKNTFSIPKAVAGEKIEKATEQAHTVSIADIRNMDIEDRLRTTGTVIVAPGILGSQFFYIVDKSASSTAGIQIYMYSKDFPELAIGDRVEAIGELAESRGEMRLKISNREDIQTIDHTGEPLPRPIEILSIGEQLEGSFVVTGGEITERKGSHMYIDDGTAEAKVYFKSGAGIDKNALAVGDLVSVSGIVSQSNDVYQLLPRSNTDITKTGVAQAAVEVTQEEKTEASKEAVEKYLTATAGGLTAILLGLLLRSRAETFFLFFKKKFSKKE